MVTGNHFQIKVQMKVTSWLSNTWDPLFSSMYLAVILAYAQHDSASSVRDLFLSHVLSNHQRVEEILKRRTSAALFERRNFYVGDYYNPPVGLKSPRVANCLRVSCLIKVNRAISFCGKTNIFIKTTKPKTQ